MSNSVYPPAPVPSAYLIKMARDFDLALGPQPTSLFGPEHVAATKAASLMIDAVLYRDLDAALREAGKAECEANGTEYQYDGAPYSLQLSGGICDPSRRAPKRHTYQAAYRDHWGWACRTERMATWVAAWIARHLDPRDADGNPSPNVVLKTKIAGGDAWLAVRGTSKVAD